MIRHLDTRTPSRSYIVREDFFENTPWGAIELAGMLCNDAIDMSTLTLDPLDMEGTVAVAGRDITVTLDINTSAPLDPDNPGLGTLTVTGTVIAEGAVPLPDVPTFVDVLTGAITDADLACESDVNGDGYADGRDVQPYVQALTAGG